MEANAEGNLEVFQEGFAPGYREGPARLGQDAQGLWPLAGATEVKITRKRWGVGACCTYPGLGCPQRSGRIPGSDASGVSISEGQQGHGEENYFELGS